MFPVFTFNRYALLLRFAFPVTVPCLMLPAQHESSTYATCTIHQHCANKFNDTTNVVVMLDVIKQRILPLRLILSFCFAVASIRIRYANYAVCHPMVRKGIGQRFQISLVRQKIN